MVRESEKGCDCTHKHAEARHGYAKEDGGEGIVFVERGVKSRLECGWVNDDRASDGYKVRDFLVKLNEFEAETT